MECKEVSSRLLWVKVKNGRELWVFVFALHMVLVLRGIKQWEALLNDLDCRLQSF